MHCFENCLTTCYFGLFWLCSRFFSSMPLFLKTPWVSLFKNLLWSITKLPQLWCLCCWFQSRLISALSVMRQVFFCKYSEPSLWNNLTWSFNVIFSSSPSRFFSHCSSFQFIQTMWIYMSGLFLLHTKLEFPPGLGSSLFAVRSLTKWLSL